MTQGLTGGCGGVDGSADGGVRPRFWRRVPHRFGGRSAALPVPIWPPKNPAPPRHLPALPHAFLAARVLPHALAGGLVLVLEMMVLRVVPAGAELGLPRGLLLLGTANALLDGARGLAAAVVAGRTAPLGIRGGHGEEGDREDGEAAESNHGAISRFLR